MAKGYRGKLADIRQQRSGVGITGIRERVRHFDGTMEITSDRHGTTVTVTLAADATANRA